MTRREEIRERIEKLEYREFLINMTDHWTNSDREILAEVRKEIREAKEELKALKD